MSQTRESLGMWKERLVGCLSIVLASSLMWGGIAWADDDWGPLAGPWRRHEANPMITCAMMKSLFSVQNGPQTVIRHQDKWFTTVMTAKPTVTKLAVSDDGIRWRLFRDEPVLKPEMPWEGNYNLIKAIVPYGDGFRAYYFGKLNDHERIGLAYSEDLVHWTKHPEPIFKAENSNFKVGGRAFPACVIHHEGKWYLYYDIMTYYQNGMKGGYGRTGVAVSDDGVTLRDSPKSPILSWGEVGAWDDLMVQQCRVVQIGNWFYMLYSGNSAQRAKQRGGKSVVGKGGQSFGLARARHPEGPWAKYPRNPVFTPSDKNGDWDDLYLQHACPIQVDGRWRLYYNGYSRKDGKYGIGMAEQVPPAKLPQNR